MSDFDPEKYYLLYKIEPSKEGKTKAEIPEGYSATHAIFMASIMYPEDGSYSVLFDSCNGAGEQLDDNEWFKLWAMFTIRLSHSKEITGWKRAAVSAAQGQIQAAMAALRKHTEVPNEPLDEHGCTHENLELVGGLPRAGDLMVDVRCHACGACGSTTITNDEVRW